MRPSNLLRLYGVRLRARLWQECFAVAGIAVGVALLFASQVSSSSLQSSVTQLSRGLLGNATLQLLARSPEGFPQNTLARVRAIPGVRIAAPVLETPANAIGPRGNESVELIGADSSLSRLGGALVRHAELRPFGGIGAVALPAPLARTIGVSGFGQEVTFQLAGHTARAPLYTPLLDERQIGQLAESPVAIAPLSFAQEMAGLPARLSRILVQPAAGSERRVHAALQTLAARQRLNLGSASYDEKLFSKAATASSQSTRLFAVIGALIGFLFAFNAMLFTVPQRRRLIATLRRDGYGLRTVIAVLLLDALALGAVASALGLALGEELLLHVLHPNPAFLSLAFAVGSQQVVSWQSIALAGAGGILAAALAVLSPLREIRSRDPLAATSSARAPAHRARAAGRLALAGLACLLAATAILLAAPQAAIAGMVLLLAALLLELPIALAAAVLALTLLARTITSSIPHVAAMELGADPGRAVAIAATGALALFGSVAVGGAHGDLLTGLRRAAQETNASTELWVSPAGSYDLLDTTPFPAVQQAKLERLPGVRAVRLFRGGLLDYGERRLLVLAPPSGATPLLPRGQLTQGEQDQASERVRAGGWLILSRAVAEEHHLRIGQTLTLPTPRPSSFRLAGLSTNLGWAPGALIMNASDYAHAWGSEDASAYEILLTSGVSTVEGIHQIERALGAHSGLTVQSAGQHEAQQDALSRQALARLAQIATLILIAAVLAMAAAIGALIWQRRPRLAKLRLDGLPRVGLWQTMLLESLLLLGVGCLTGALFGLYGQQLADHALASLVNFPVAYSITALMAVKSLALVTGAALAILALPGYLAASVPASLALQD